MTLPPYISPPKSNVQVPLVVPERQKYHGAISPLGNPLYDGIIENP